MSPRARLLGSLLFAVTMGIFEAAVVVYLRRLWVLGEIDVASASLSNRLVLTEVVREIASLGMIASVAYLAGRRGLERLGHAAAIFGTWDIVFYVLLRLLIGWPASLFDWDVLFLIPRPWIGPVLAPVLVSIALVAGGAYVTLREGGDRPLSIGLPAWAGACLGGVVVVVSFLIPQAPHSATEQPTGFSWILFLAGLTLSVAGFGHGVWRSRESRPAPVGIAGQSSPKREGVP